VLYCSHFPISGIDLLRKQLIKLQKEREKITLEKGLAARDNNDLRENFAYDYWVEQEFVITAKIHGILKEIERLSPSRPSQYNKKRKSASKKP